MLQIDHVYEFLYQELFKEFELWNPINGVIKTDPIKHSDVSVFTSSSEPQRKIFFYDQEPFIFDLADQYIKDYLSQPGLTPTLATSEYSSDVNQCCMENDFHQLYYFFHGFASMDWYRSYHALNYSKPVIKPYKHDFISYNRLLTDDRSYRLYFVSLLAEHNLLKDNLVSFGVTDTNIDWLNELSNPYTRLSKQAINHIIQYAPKEKLVIDNAYVQGSASANIPRSHQNYFAPGTEPPNVDAFWHVVTETVFYYPKLHLTEKIFKPIVSKQPFMLLAAPGNLAYLKSYGFKTFDSIIDESYDNINDHDARIAAVVAQLKSYCELSEQDKMDMIYAVEHIVEHNFHHFYGEFKHIITRELLDNTKNLFKELGYNDSKIDYESIYYVLTK